MRECDGGCCAGTGWTPDVLMIGMECRDPSRANRFDGVVGAGSALRARVADTEERRVRSSPCHSSDSGWSSGAATAGGTDTRGAGSTGDSDGRECKARSPSSIRLWMRRAMSSSRSFIASPSESVSSAIGSGAAPRCSASLGVCPRVGDRIVELGRLVSDVREDDDRVGVLCNVASCWRVAMMSSAMLGRLILRLRLRRGVDRLAAGDELAMVLASSRMVSYAGGGSEWSGCTSPTSPLMGLPPCTSWSSSPSIPSIPSVPSLPSLSSGAASDLHPLQRRYAVLMLACWWERQLTIRRRRRGQSR